MAVRNNLLYFVQANGGGDIATDGKPLQPDKSYVVYDAKLARDRINLIENAEVDCVIDWGDETIPTANTGGGLVYHNYAEAGRYLITISGKFYGFNSRWGHFNVNDEIVSAYLGTNCYGSGVFYCCGNLETVVIDTPHIVSISDRAFEDCRKLSTVRFPTLRDGSSRYGGNITSIGKNAFVGCQILERFTMPDLVTTIGDRAFAYCYLLREVVFNRGLKQIGKEAFSYCETLKKIALPNSLLYINEAAFKKCYSLRTLEYMADDVASLTSVLPQYSIFEDCKIARIVATSMENARDIEDMITSHGGEFATVLEPNSECSGINALLDEINGEVV